MSPHPALVYPVVNTSLAIKLEHAEARACRAYLETKRRLDPMDPVAWLRVAGAEALYDGASSPLTQSFGLGLLEPANDAILAQLEAFFAARRAVCSHEVSALAAASTWNALSQRGYAPIEASTVLVRPTTHLPRNEARVSTRLIESTETERWAAIFADGVHEESEELGQILVQLGRVIARSGAACFFAEINSEPIAAAVVNLQGEVAVLGGARTIRAARRQGAQAALLAARLEFAASHGIGLAMMVADRPGSQSQRNAERQGFRPAYTRTKWELRTPMAAI